MVNGFKIVVDNIYDEKDNFTLEGRVYGDYSEGQFKFRVLDDDGNVYFEGLSDDNSSFEPLDRVGVNYGAVEIQYFEDGQYKTL